MGRFTWMRALAVRPKRTKTMARGIRVQTTSRRSFPWIWGGSSWSSGLARNFQVTYAKDPATTRKIRKEKK
jgi:hypothetical protein